MLCAGTGVAAGVPTTTIHHGGEMTANPALDPGPFALDGGPVGCLLLHGFTGSPPEMRLLGEYLHSQGLAVSAPLLPGHGTTPQDLNRVRWLDWVATAEGTLAELRTRCQTVFVGGLSMGALLTLDLAARHPDLGGIALYSPALKLRQKSIFLLPLVRHLVRQWPAGRPEDTDLTDPEAPARIWHYDTFPTTGANELLKLLRLVRGEIKRVRVPAIIFYATLDKMIAPDAARLTFNKLGSQDKELVTLHNSGHCLTVDTEREAVFARTYGFILAHTKT